MMDQTRQNRLRASWRREKALVSIPPRRRRTKPPKVKQRLAHRRVAAIRVTAKRLGIKLPAPVLIRADEVIE
jgi:hypothetical protein